MDDKGNIKIDELGKKVKKVGGTVTKESKKMQSAWAKSANAIKSNVLGLVSMTAAVFAIRGAVKTVLAFEDAMAEVSTIVDTSTVNMHKLNAEILDLSTRVPKDAANLAQGLYQTISAGVTDVSDAMIVLEASSKAATAGLTSTFVAVDAGTTIMNAYGKTVEDITGIQDVLFNTVKEGKTKYDSLANSIGRAAPIAAQVGVKFEELTAAAATLTKGGLSTEEAMTSIRAIMVGILKPTTDAEILAKKLKLQFDSEALAAKGLGGFLEEVTEKTGGNTQAITALFGNVRALTGVMALAGKQADEFKRIIESNTTAAGIMNEAFEKINVTITSQWQLFKNQFNKTLLETSESILPGVTTALQSVNEQMGRKGLGQTIIDYITGAQIAENITLALVGRMEELKTETEETNVALKPFVADITTLSTVSAASSSNLVIMNKGVDELKTSLEDIDTPFKAILEHFRALDKLKEKTIIPDIPDIPKVTELTENQKAILEIKKAILAAEQTSLLTQVAINQIEAERIANGEIMRGLTESDLSDDTIKVDSVNQLVDANRGLVDTKMEELELSDNIAKQTQAQVLAEGLLAISATVVKDAMFGMAQGLAQAIVHGESLSKVFDKLIKQMATRGLGALFGAGIGFAFGGPAGAFAGAKIGAGIGGEHGLDMTVPPGFPGDSFPVFATSGERVQITPTGGQRGETGGGVNVSLALTVNAQMSQSEATGIAQRGLDIIASDFKQAITSRKIRRSDLEKAV